MRTTLALCLCLPLLAAGDPLKLDSGQVSGVPGHSPEVRVYKGIPFAAPPVGDLRWKGPKPAAAWSGVRKADQFSAACQQLPYAESSIYYAPAEPVSEDCLYMNVWTAAKSANERRPVMVWIYGGALTRGSGSRSTYDGENFAKKGVVLVTFNYRVGIFGFLAHPELTKESDRNSSGNYGVLDQIAALEWVQRNIAAFGGDPKNVTIFGQSAGSWSVNCLMASPLAKGLFHRAIGESGGDFGPMLTQAEAEKTGLGFAKSVGADSLAALRAKSAGELLKAASSMPAKVSVDGWLLPQDIYSIFAAGKQNDVPLMVGFTANESGGLLALNPTKASFPGIVRSVARGDADLILKTYPAETDEQAKAATRSLFTDMVFGYAARAWASLETQTGKSKAFAYYFTHVPPGPIGEQHGAYHAVEIPYVFENLSWAKTPYNDSDRELARTVSAYWVNFAKTGDPNGKGLPEWPAYQASSDRWMEFGDRPHFVANLRKAELDMWETVYAGRRRGN